MSVESRYTSASIVPLQEAGGARRRTRTGAPGGRSPPRLRLCSHPRHAPGPGAIRYALCPSPFGTLFLAVGGSGICMLAFPQGPGDARALERLTRLWGPARPYEDPRHVTAWVERILGSDTADPEPIDLLVKGSAFQIQVWRSLLEIPRGALSSYQRLAQAIGRPRAVRAVANAVGANPIAYLIPCHRVIRSDGTLGGYRWGVACKRALLAREAGLG